MTRSHWRRSSGWAPWTSGFQSLAYPGAAPSLIDDFIRSELRKNGYYYAQGLTSASLITLEMGRVEVLFLSRLQSFWSIDRGGKHQGEITNNFPMSDSRLSFQATAAARPFAGPLRLAAGYEQLRRQSGLPGYRSVEVGRRGTLSLLLVF